MSLIKAKLTRTYFSPKLTLGMFGLYLDEKLLFRCYTCEDMVRGNGDPKTVVQWKVKGDSAIPYGIYPLKFTWSEKFGKNVWEICNVPGFKGIRIHAGNTEKDTEGCILLGEHINGDYNGITHSVKAVGRFEAVMDELIEHEAFIEIVKESA